jgi:pyruvate dehydrogenase E2 component (dihydrolipoamide acetyltransferase)
MTEKEENKLSQQGVTITEVIQLKGSLKILADHMANSHKEYASVPHLSEVDATDFVEFRQKLNTRIMEEEGVSVSFTHVLLKVLASCLKEFPIVNSTIEGDNILLLGEINIGLAVSTVNEMLIAPVIKHADRKSIVEISKESRALAHKARDNSLGLNDLIGGTFTLTNFGMYESKFSTSVGLWTIPLIVIPQSAILGIGGLYQKPVIRNNKIKIRTMLPTSFTFDHRIINGIPAVKFMNKFYEFIENPGSIDLGI